MFTQRFNELLELLGLSGSSEPARVLGCDRSYISRLRSGDRVPAPGSRAGNRLLAAFFQYAEKAGALPRVAAHCGVERVTADSLIAWLWEGWQPPESAGNTAPGARKRDPVSGKLFGERLSALMDLAGLTNARLARLANVDASLLSRYRRGLRSPERGRRIVEVLANVLLDRICAKEGPEALCLLMGAEELGDREQSLTELMNWLFEDTGKENGLIEAFLTDLQRFDPHAIPPLLSPEQALEPSPEAGCPSAYWGRKGLQQAVLRFLSEAIRAGEGELWLYSDQPMGWMTEEPEFVLRWRSLMVLCIRRGIRIRIIHNVDRGLKELLDAIRSWMPLYMSGMVESFYSPRPRGSRFSHTLFLFPGRAAISCTFPVGQEEKARYRYDTEPEELEAAAAFYSALLDEARPLFHVSPSLESEPDARVFSPRSVPGVELAVGERSVTVTHLEPPHLSFTVTHPLMREAFAAYIERAEQE